MTDHSRRSAEQHRLAGTDAAGELVSFTVAELVAQFELERIEVDHFRALHGPGRHVFGGQVLGQALVAAASTVAHDRRLHSLHSYFLRPGDSSRPLLFSVERIRDGRTFTTRRVVGIQAGRAIFSLAASYQADEPGFEHAAEMPSVEPPEGLARDLDYYRGQLVTHPWMARFAFRYQAIDSRQVEGIQMMPREGRSALLPRKNTWMRIVGESTPSWARALPAGTLDQALLAYMSDMDFMSTTTLPHGPQLVGHDLQGASLDHAIWFHRPVRASDWLLFSKESPTASGARGFVRGSFFTRSGELVASVMQECLIRLRTQSGASSGRSAHRTG